MVQQGFSPAKLPAMVTVLEHGIAHDAIAKVGFLHGVHGDGESVA